MMTSLIYNLLSYLMPQKPRERPNYHGLPLPPVCHMELTSSHINDRPVFVIGDVHGCLAELKELMDAARDREPRVLFVLVGDLVNKGPDSVGVVRFLRNMPPGDVYAVRGNQDEKALYKASCYCAGADNEGNPFKLSKKSQWIKDMSEDDLTYLSNLPYTISIPSLNALVVHAGLMPGKPLEQQDLNDLTNIRNILFKTDTFSGNEELVGTPKITAGVSWTDLYPGKTHVYFGHDARRKLQLKKNATGLDTACVYGGKLTGVFIDKDGPRTFITVDSIEEPAYDNVKENTEIPVEFKSS